MGPKFMSPRYLSVLLLLMAILGPLDACAQQTEASAEKTVIDASRQATVRIVSGNINGGTGSVVPLGSGFFVSSQYVVTCFHVVTKSLDIDPKQKKCGWSPVANLAVLYANREIIKATCISVPTLQDISPVQYDFAVLRLEHPPKAKITVLPLAPPDTEYAVGEEVFFSGYPLDAKWLLTFKGMIAGFYPLQKLIALQAPINKGSSGSALLNTKGEVIGIISRREGGITEKLDEIKKKIIEAVKPGQETTIMFGGIDALDSIKETVEVLNRNISTGIGYAHWSGGLSQYLSKHNLLEAALLKDPAPG